MRAHDGPRKYFSDAERQAIEELIEADALAAGHAGDAWPAEIRSARSRVALRACAISLLLAVCERVEGRGDPFPNSALTIEPDWPHTRLPRFVREEPEGSA